MTPSSVNDAGDFMTAIAADARPARKRRPWWRSLYIQVLAAIFIGAALGHFHPALGEAMKPLGDGFIKLIKMVVGPIIFCTVVTGMTGMSDIGQAGRVGAKAILFFLAMGAFSLALGMAVANAFQPGKGMNIDPATLDANLAATYVGEADKKETAADFLLHIIPATAVDAFARGEILQVLFFSMLFAVAAMLMGDKARPVVGMIDQLSHVFFSIIGIIMKIAPLGAFGAMAFTVGKYGLASMVPLAKLMLCFYLTCIVFIFAFQAVLIRWCGLSLWRFLNYIKAEIFIVFGTCSSETVFPRMVDKLTALGCDKAVVGMALPTGYSFNLSGSAIYLTMAAIFLAQATNTPMTLQEQLVLLGVMMLTSKGAAGVVGTAFVALAATLASVGNIPVAAITLILGIDRFMAEGRAVTNLINNGIATLFIAKWEGKLDVSRARRVLAGEEWVTLETAT